MSYEQIVFDLYGTLVDIHTDEQKEVLWRAMSWFYCLHQADYTSEKLKKSYHQCVRNQEIQLKSAKDVEYPEIDLIEVFKELYAKENVFCDECLAEETALFFRACSLEKLRLYDGIKEFLKELKEAGKKIYLLTNAQRLFTEREIRYLGIEKMFDGIVYSSEEGTKKPDRHFYECIEQLCHLDKNKTVMIGNDAECDVCGALNVGWSAIHLVSNIAGSGVCPDCVKVFEMSELDLLKKELIKSGQKR